MSACWTLEKTEELSCFPSSVCSWRKAYPARVSRSNMLSEDRLIWIGTISRAKYDCILSARRADLTEDVYFIRIVFPNRPYCQLINQLQTRASISSLRTDATHTVLYTPKAGRCSPITEGLCESAWQNVDSFLSSWTRNVGVACSKDTRRRRSGGGSSDLGVVVRQSRSSGIPVKLIILSSKTQIGMTRFCVVRDLVH